MGSCVPRTSQRLLLSATDLSVVHMPTHRSTFAAASLRCQERANPLPLDSGMNRHSYRGGRAHRQVLTRCQTQQVRIVSTYMKLRCHPCGEGEAGIHWVGRRVLGGPISGCDRRVHTSRKMA